MFSLVALAGVAVMSINAEIDGDPTRLFVRLAGLLAVLGSWLSNVASFALQYARDNADDDESGFSFPNEIEPEWSDYLYAAVMVSATLSTGDVTVISTKRRKMIALHILIAFAFNTVIIAMLIATLMS